MNKKSKKTTTTKTPSKKRKTSYYIVSVSGASEKKKFRTTKQISKYLASLRQNSKIGNAQMGLPIFTLTKNGKEITGDDLAMIKKETWMQIAIQP